MASGDVTGAVATISQKDCAVFDGVDDYVDIPHNANQLGANLSNGFTISAWINPRSAGEADNGRILDKSDGGTAQNGFYYRVQPNGVLQFRLNSGTAIATGNDAIVFGAWNHVLVTVTSAQIASHYVNGVLQAGGGDLIETIATITTTDDMRIGNQSSITTQTFDGAIKDVKMWNRVLTADEIEEDYNGITTPSGTILDVPLTSDYNDISSTGLTGTNSGTYLANTMANKLKADVESLTLAAATDIIQVDPIPKSPKQFVVSTAQREA